MASSVVLSPLCLVRISVCLLEGLVVIYSERSVSVSTSGCLGDVSWRQTRSTDLDIAQELNLDFIRVKLGW